MNLSNKRKDDDILKKKLLLLLTVVFASLFILAACGSSDGESADNEDASEEGFGKMDYENKDKDGSSEDFDDDLDDILDEDQKEDYYDKLDEDEPESDSDDADELSDDAVEDDDYKIEIKDVEQIDGEPEADVLALEIEFTNKSESPVSPWSGAVGLLHAQQETDETVETLRGANAHFPGDYKPELVGMGGTKVKGGGTTVDAVIGYQIEYSDEDVHLMDFNANYEPETFERVVETE